MDYTKLLKLKVQGTSLNSKKTPTIAYYATVGFTLEKMIQF